jgi:hypothetical protein
MQQHYVDIIGMPYVPGASLMLDVIGGFGLRFQPIDATHWLKRSAGVS